MKYEDSDFDELPADAKSAAEKMGYTKEMWDADEGKLQFVWSLGKTLLIVGSSSPLIQ